MKPNKMEVVQARPVSYKFPRQETQKEILMAYSFRNPSDGIYQTLPRNQQDHCCSGII